jgi:cbb3-type cytochrome oxidase maturation protein
MDVFIYFIPITIIIASIILITLLWNIKNDQYQDLKYKGYNILFIDERNNNK